MALIRQKASWSTSWEPKSMLSCSKIGGSNADCSSSSFQTFQRASELGAACKVDAVSSARINWNKVPRPSKFRAPSEIGNGRCVEVDVPCHFLTPMTSRKEPRMKVAAASRASSEDPKQEHLPSKKAARRHFLAVSTCLCCTLAGSKHASNAESLDDPLSKPLCSQCHGTGALPCSLCGGTGQWLQGLQNGNQVRIECPQCSGRGMLKCVRCLGTGLGDTGGLLRGAAVKEGHMRVRADGSIEILDCDYFPATRGTDCRPSESDNRITEERAQTAPRGSLYPRPDLVDLAKKTWRILDRSTDK